MMRSGLISCALRFVPFSVRDRIKSIPGIAYLQRAVISRALEAPSSSIASMPARQRASHFSFACPRTKAFGRAPTRPISRRTLQPTWSQAR